jgi:uncharacterized repeat protein (TIGR04138 family)
MHHPKVEELVRRDPRFPPEAYEFVRAALNHTLGLLGRQGADAGPDDGHVSPRQWLEGMRDLARQEFGLMAPAVLRMWGVHRTDDLGDIVFNLVEAGLVSRMPQEGRADFHDVFDLDALTRDYTIEVPAESPEEV